MCRLCLPKFVQLYETWTLINKTKAAIYWRVQRTIILVSYNHSNNRILHSYTHVICCDKYTIQLFFSKWQKLIEQYVLQKISQYPEIVLDHWREKIIKYVLYNYIISDIDMECPPALTNGVFRKWKWAGKSVVGRNAECLQNVQQLRMHRLANMQNLQVRMLTLKIPTTEKIHHSKYKHKYIKLVQHAIIFDINMF